MLGIKRLYWFMLKSFMPLFVMTFFITLFIVLMQFLWRYIDDLVGKGLGVDVIAELFFYAALTMIPMALPLAILLASLMTFGNLGEQFELTAMKASGVSLVKSMRPLIVLIILISIGAFFFQNNVLPIAQAKMWTLLYSMRQKSPEVEIPEGVFYDQIPGYNLFVQTKDRDTGILYDMMIYDMSKGFENSRIILADSGKLAFTEDHRHLFLRLWNGESFENLKEAGANMSNVPYRRESFNLKEILVSFDANFNRMDESGMRNQYVGKNIAQLRHTIDSVEHRVDSIGSGYSTLLQDQALIGVSAYKNRFSGGSLKRTKVPDVALPHPIDIDSLISTRPPTDYEMAVTSALAKAERLRQEYEFKGLSMLDDKKTIRRHSIELQKKFTLSFACLIFFFIGAPLGAIIRKGGLGTPLVISVFLFIVYYIIDNTGYKLARDGKWEVWEGMWLSAAVLLPLGIFFTYKAVNDSAVFNADAYINFFRRLTGRNSARLVEFKEISMVDIERAKAFELINALDNAAKEYLESHQARPGYINYWLHGYSRTALKSLSRQLESTVEYLSNSRNLILINKLMDYPVIRSLWLYHPTNYKPLAWAAIALFPVGVPLYLLGLSAIKQLRAELEAIRKVDTDLHDLVTKETSTQNAP